MIVVNVVSLPMTCAGTVYPVLLAYIEQAIESCRRFERQETVLAADRALLNAGKRMPMRTAMMATTTRSSTRVKAQRKGRALALPIFWPLTAIASPPRVDSPPDAGSVV